MGLLGTIGDVASGALDVAPIPGSDAVASGIDAAQEAFGDDGGGEPQGRGSRARTTTVPQLREGQNLPAPPRDGGPQPPRRDSSGVNLGFDIPGLGGATFSASNVSQQGGQRGGGGSLPMQGGFQGAIMMELLEESISTQDGRAVMEALTSGSLQGGVIQRPANVNTPRGTRNVSPPGFRTVYLGGDDDEDAYAVFKPLARSLGLIGRESPRTFREKLDDTTRQFLKHRNEFEDLAKKLGLKTQNRASGPTR